MHGLKIVTNTTLFPAHVQKQNMRVDIPWHTPLGKKDGGYLMRDILRTFPWIKIYAPWHNFIEATNHLSKPTLAIPNHTCPNSRAIVDHPNAWWCHPMETFSTLLALCSGKPRMIGEFPSQRPVTRSFDFFVCLFFGQRLNKWMSKQSWGWWFETPSRSLWRHCIV